MNLSRIHAVFLFQPFRHLLSIDVELLLHEQCAQHQCSKPAQKFKKSIKSLNTG